MRIKRTLIISSIIMALIACVTIVSVSAAWFGDTLSITQEVSIQTSLPQGKIVIDTNSAINRLDNSLIPAKLNPGWALKAAQINSPYADTSTIDVLDTHLVGDDQPLSQIAQTVYVYFPIFGIGATAEEDGKLPAIVEITGAYIYKDSAQGINTETSVNYIDDLLITMEVVTNVQEEEVDDGNISYYVQTSDPVTSTPIADLKTTPNSVHWGYDKDSHKIGLLIDQGVNCYIKLGISFAKVDEDLPPELMNTLIKLNVIVPQSPTRSEVRAITKG